MMWRIPTIFALLMLPSVYAQERDKTGYLDMTTDTVKAQPYFFCFVDYSKSFSATQEPNPEDYAAQIEIAAMRAYPTSGMYGVGYTHADSAATVLEIGTNIYRATVSATVVLVEIDTKSTRQTRVAGDFPSLADFVTAMAYHMGFAAPIASVTDSTNVCHIKEAPHIGAPQLFAHTSTPTKYEG